MWRRLLASAFVVTQAPILSDYIPPPNQCYLKMFTGSNTSELGNEIAGILGISLGRSQLGHFSDGESSVKVFEDVSGKDVFLISSLGNPINDTLIELILTISAVKRANCRKVILVIPYLAYNRQDLPTPNNLYTPAEDIPKLIEAFEPDLIIGVDFHGEHLDGYFSIPVHEISPYKIAVEYFKRKPLMNPVIISPDVRGTRRAYEFFMMLKAEGISCDFAVFPNRGGKLAYVGEENVYLGDKLTGRDVIIIDDMVITGNSVFKSLEVVRKKDAEKVYCFATHPVLSEGTVQKINNSSLDEYICLNTLPIKEKSGKIVQLSVAGSIAEKIKEVYEALP